MESEEAQLLRTIRALPNDDAPRLVYADWLEENGKAERAEFIRLQCALASQPDDDAHRNALLLRERRLWRKQGGSWKADLPARLRNSPFQRGFVQPNVQELSVSQFFALGEDFLDFAPGWTVKLIIRSFDPVPVLMKHNHLARLTGLGLQVNGADPDGLGELLASPSLKNLRSLHIEGHPFGLDHMRIIASSPALEGLRRLGVFCNTLRAEGAEAIARSPFLKNLESLDLNGCRIGDEGLRALASSTGLHHLRELNLPQNELDNSAASAIIASRPLKRLQALGLFGNHLGDAGARLLALGRNLERLNRLDLGLNRIGPSGGRALADSPYLIHLRQLYLGGNRVSDDPIAIDALKTRFGEKVTV